MTLQRAGIGATRACPQDLADLTAFHLQNHGAHSRQVQSRWMDWRFASHPLVGEGGPDLWLCRRNEQIVGAQSGLAADFMVSGQALRGIWAIDLMVDPTWRLRGVAPALNAALEQGKPVVAGLGISEAAHRAMARAGWHDLGRVPVWWRMLGALPESFVGRRMSHLSRLLRWPLRAMDKLAERLSFSTLEPLSAFDGRVDDIWRAAAAGGVIARRDLSMLRWRFDQSPSAAAYQRFLLMARGKPRGYVVLRMVTDECQVRRALLVDYLCPPAWTGILLVQAMAQARRQGAEALACLANKGGGWFTALGFIRRPGIRLMVRVGEQAQGLVKVLGERRNWFVTFADSDLDHV